MAQGCSEDITTQNNDRTKPDQTRNSLKEGVKFWALGFFRLTAKDFINKELLRSSAST